MKRSLPAICAILLGIVFLVSGGWKVLSPFKTGELLEQAQVPAGFGPLGAATLGIADGLSLIQPEAAALGRLAWLGPDDFFHDLGCLLLSRARRPRMQLLSAHQAHRRSRILYR